MTNVFLQFDGSGLVTVPHDASLNINSEDFTICFWIKPSSDIGSILEKIVNEVGYQIILSIDDKVELSIKSILMQTIVIDRTINVWQHIAFSYDLSGNCIPYRNAIAGTPVDVSGGPGSPDNAEDLLIGSGLEIGIDAIQLYKGEALSQAQIQAIYDAGRIHHAVDSDFTDGWYSNFKDGSGLTVSGRKIVSGVGSDLNGTINSLDHVSWEGETTKYFVGTN